MGKRVRMPLCWACGWRIYPRYNRWIRFSTALERATLLALHRAESPLVKYDAIWNPVTETYSKNLDTGYVKVLVGRGWHGLNTFCGSYCAMRWLKTHPPEVTWEPWPTA